MQNLPSNKKELVGEIISRSREFQPDLSKFPLLVKGGGIRNKTRGWVGGILTFLSLPIFGLISIGEGDWRFMLVWAIPMLFFWLTLSKYKKVIRIAQDSYGKGVDPIRGDMVLTHDGLVVWPPLKLIKGVEQKISYDQISGIKYMNMYYWGQHLHMFLRIMLKGGKTFQKDLSFSKKNPERVWEFLGTLSKLSGVELEREWTASSESEVIRGGMLSIPGWEETVALVSLIGNMFLTGLAVVGPPANNGEKNMFLLMTSLPVTSAFLLQAYYLYKGKKSRKFSKDYFQNEAAWTYIFLSIVDGIKSLFKGKASSTSTSSEQGKERVGNEMSKIAIALLIPVYVRWWSGATGNGKLKDKLFASALQSLLISGVGFLIVFIFLNLTIPVIRWVMSFPNGWLDVLSRVVAGVAILVSVILWFRGYKNKGK